MSVATSKSNGNHSNLHRRGTLSDPQNNSSSLADPLSSNTQIGSQRKPRAQQLRRASNQAARFIGEWKGSVTSTVYGFNPPRYSYTMNLERRGKSSIVGVTTIRDFINPSIFGVMTMRGRVSNGALLFKETSIYNQEIPSTIGRWCLKGGRLQLTRYSNGRTFLSGSWSEQNCNDGLITVEKQFQY